MIKKISITGPESTGKSWLCEKLAKKYNTIWVPEYAREYLNKLDRKYKFDDIEIIAKKQLEIENSLLEKANKYIFVDTDFLVTKIWSEFVFNKCSKWITEKYFSHKYDLYLLCDIDLPWQYDPQREHPHLRNELFEIYLKELNNLNCNFKIVSGINYKRLYCAVNYIDNENKKILIDK